MVARRNPESFYRIYLPDKSQWVVTWRKIAGYKSGSPMLRVHSDYIGRDGYRTPLARTDEMSFEELESYMSDLKRKGYKVKMF